jgi:2-keto-4-pentenoate hydratase/2-oxohepta-3-ene-1,7-dioic acid hydratase in catechol pathway
LKIARYMHDGNVSLGLVEDDRVLDINRSAEALGFEGLAKETCVENLLEDKMDSLRSAAPKMPGLGFAGPIASVKFLSPIAEPEKILCAAVNYRAHGKESDMAPPAEPYFFTKFRNALIGDGDPIVIPRMSKKADWEVELSVIIGKAGKDIAREDAMEHVAGYAVSNDVSFRDLQFPQWWKGSSQYGQNWVKGKGLDTAFPLGPWLVTRDEVKDPLNLSLSLSVNGKVMQKSTTADMVFGIDYLVEYLSAGMTLKPGDVISTGTPFGVALATGEPFLKHGDFVEASVEGVGTLRNPVVAEGR